MEAMRQCLKCPKEFLSAGPHNRICPVCKEINDKVRVPRKDSNTKETGSGFRRGVSVGGRQG